MKSLDHILTELESKMASSEVLNTNVSQNNVAWHIGHSLKVIYNIIKMLQHSKPEEYRWKFNRNRSFVYTFNHIPRGKGKAPKSVIPADDISIQQLQEELHTVRQMVLTLDGLSPKSNFMHPYLGQLNLKHSQKFLVIHTQHHLKIIEDII